MLIKYIPLILLKIIGAAGSAALLKKLDTTQLKSYRYDNESFDEIHQLENLLNNCKRYTFHE